MLREDPQVHVLTFPYSVDEPTDQPTNRFTEHELANLTQSLVDAVHRPSPHTIPQNVEDITTGRTGKREGVGDMQRVTFCFQNTQFTFFLSLRIASNMCRLSLQTGVASLSR